MEHSFHLDIISLTRPAFSGKVTSITVPGMDGELTILPGHIPLITPLKSGEVTIRDSEKTTYMAISSGFLIVDKEKTTLLADSAEHLEELDEKKIEEAKERAEKLLTDKKFADDRAFADATAMLEKSVAHLKIIRRRKSHR